ncbi:baculoviral IAP repeat-containing protein 5.1-like [Pelobates fuscus]|uniref:baculoviral IAP repeat-containing protein 5.1-like n=1 Tax=Pelobates fuscus TaxID=191477 RepID=UPI002FE444D8
MQLAEIMCKQAIQRLQDYRHMYDYEKRLSTFSDWPFTENCNCTPENMAKAGFIHRPSENEPDVVCCFFCLTELEGWEPDDNPWTEHIKRSSTCGFLNLSGSVNDLTVEAFLRLEADRIKCFYRVFSTLVLNSVDEARKATTKRLLEYFSNQHHCSIDLDSEL